MLLSSRGGDGRRRLSYQGLKDLDQLGLAVQITFIQLAAAADKLLELSQMDPTRLEVLMRGA